MQLYDIVGWHREFDSQVPSEHVRDNWRPGEIKLARIAGGTGRLLTRPEIDRLCDSGIGPVS